MEQALIAADKAGDTNGARLIAQELASAHSAAPASNVKGTAGTFEGVSQGVADTLSGAAQLLPRAAKAGLGGLGVGIPGIDSVISAADKNAQASNADYEQARANAGNKGFDTARLAGNVASPLNFIGGEAAGALPAAKSLLGRLFQNATVGGLTSAATTPVTSGDYGSEKLKQTATGAAAGTILPAAANAVGRVMAPTVNPMARKLLDAGIRLTPGQILGGQFKGIEDKISSIPLAGGFQQAAQRRSVEDFNRVALNSALEPIGKSLASNAPIGRKGIDAVAKSIGNVYDTILPQMTGKIDQQFASDLTATVNNARASGVATSTLDQLQNVIKGQLADKVSPAGTFDGTSLKEIQSELGRISNMHLGSDSADQRYLGTLVQDIHDDFNSMLLRNNPAQADTLQAANAAWARYARIRRAGSMVGAKEGIFSGPQFANAVRASDKSVGKGAYAKGQALMQDLSDPATNILPSGVPDSGTAGRLLMGTALTGVHALTPLIAPVTAMSAAYTKPGQALIRALLSKRPKAIQQAGTQLISGSANPALAIPFASLTAAMGNQ